MTGEIVPAPEEAASSSSPDETTTDYEDDAPLPHFIRSKPSPPLHSDSLRPLDSLDLRAIGNPVLKSDLTGGDYHIAQFLSSMKGHKHAIQFSPTPNSVKSLLQSIKEPSVLLLQGCNRLILQPHEFPFHKFETLTTLEISRCSNLTALPGAISGMTQLQTLRLSHLPIEQLPPDFFSNLTNLRSLVLEACLNLRFLPRFPELHTLEYLQLSDLLVENLPRYFFDNFPSLVRVILRGCSKLHSLPLTARLQKLEVLDLSHCTALKEFDHYIWHPKLQLLDLSCTALSRVPIIREPSCLTHLFLRDTNVTGSYYLKFVTSLQVLDLSRSQNVRRIVHVQGNKDLVALDLSRTGIESIDLVSDLIHLHHLILRECICLVKLPAMKRLTNLEVLDVSGCEILDDLPEDLNSLTNLKELNLSGCRCLKELREGLFDQLTSLEKLQILNLSHTSVAKLPDMSNLVNLKELLLADCVELRDLSQLQTLISLEALEVLDLSLPDDCTTTDSNFQAEPETVGQVTQIVLTPRSSLRKLLLTNRSGVLKLFSPESLAKLEHLDLHGTDETCPVGGKISGYDELHLVSTFMSNSGFERFKYGFAKVDELILSIVRNLESANTTATGDANVDTVFGTTITDNTENRALKMHTDLRYILENINLLESSSNGKTSERLLNELMDATTHLSADDFPLDSTNLNELQRVVIKLKLLLPPKMVDGFETTKKKSAPLFTSLKNMVKVFVDDEENLKENPNLLSCYESLKNTEKNCLLCFSAFPCVEDLVIRKRILVHWWFGEGFIDPQNEQNPSLKTVEEVGKQILKVLEEKGFIEPVIIKRRETGICSMKPIVHSFVTARAKEESFFDFRDNSGKLSLHLTRFQRARLLKSQDNFLSSCDLWANNASSYRKLKKFKTKTLINVNEPELYIRSEWFSKMKDLQVLHLGRWDFENEEQIEVIDQQFLEDLKVMKQLRLLSLQGFSTITKFPESLCKLANLKILNLRDCTYLEELPVGIGSLRNLTYLDLRHCPILSKFPKGMKHLSKLEVLKGFVITFQIGGLQHRNACTLAELSKLDNLRKLTLIVNKDEFPITKDLQAFAEMKSLCSLEISWEKGYNTDQGPHELRNPRWQKLKWWEHKTLQNEADEPLKGSYLDKLQKLVLCCYPYENAPDWLHPTKLHKLEKLYIVGGGLATLPGDGDQNRWNVRDLRLKYLRKLYTHWPRLRGMFPHMTYFEHYRCDLLTLFPPEVWIESDEK